MLVSKSDVMRVPQGSKSKGTHHDLMQHLGTMLAREHYMPEERRESTVSAIANLARHLSASVDRGFNRTLRNRT